MLRVNYITFLFFFKLQKSLIIHEIHDTSPDFLMYHHIFGCIAERYIREVFRYIEENIFERRFTYPREEECIREGMNMFERERGMYQ